VIARLYLKSLGYIHTVNLGMRGPCVNGADLIL